MNWLGKFSIAKKFAILGFLGIVLVSVPTVFHVLDASHRIETVKSEGRAIAPTRTLLRVIQLTQQHLGLSAGYLSGNASLADERRAKEAEVNKAMEAMTLLVRSDIGDEKIAKSWDQALQKWKTVASGASSKSAMSEQNFTEHAGLVSEYLALLNLIADHFGLSTDQKPDSFHLMTATLVHLPQLTETMSQMRAKGMVLLSQKLLVGQDSFECANLLSLVAMHNTDMIRSLDKAFAENARFRQKLEVLSKEAVTQTRAATYLANRQILQIDNMTYSPVEFFKVFARAIDVQFQLHEAAMGEFDQLLRTRIVDFQKAEALILGVIALIVLLATALGWLVSRSITRPLSEAVGVAQKVAAGDLTSTIEVKTKDETGMLLQALKDMNESLKKIVGEVRSSSEAIGSGTKQIASGNADLSQRTEEQASSLEETASSMEELTSTVKQNAENARQANQLAVSASEVAVKGGAVVSEVVGTMSSINESSKKIVDIIGVIDGIAFQTNILALNAAVEAARAGEQGRGFAVVATEVRNLAQRSAAAAKEIKQLIGDSVDKVGAGTKLVDEAGKTMQEIVASVKRVTDIMSEITAASQEQSSGIEQVNQAITQMDEATQQNAALVEEAAAAAESMQEQAQNLAQAVAAFQIDQSITVLGTNFDFEKAVRAHVEWKHRLQDCVEGQGELLDAAIVSSDNRCALGEWIYGAGKPFARHEEYELLRTAHAEFHRCAGQVAKLMQDGRLDAARQLLGSEFEVESKNTIGRIYAMRGLTEEPTKARPAAERRSPNRAANVARLPGKPGKAQPAAPRAKRAAAGGGEDKWGEF